LRGADTSYVQGRLRAAFGLQVRGKEEVMSALQTVLIKLNREFNDDNIGRFAQSAEMFAPGKRLDIGFLVPTNTPLYRAWKSYMKTVPEVFQETVRSVLYHALTTEPPTGVTMAWAPGYDHEVTVWQAPDSNTTKGGITVLIKGRYPGDTHPLAAGTPAGPPAAKKSAKKSAKKRSG